MFGEKENKYLAGLLDADGNLCFVNNNGYLHIVMSLSMSESIDRNGRFAKYLADKVGRLQTRKRDDNWAIQNEWVVNRRSDLEKLLPHVIKHMVVKGAKWNAMLKIYRSKPNHFDLELLRKEVDIPGPVKPKSHPSWPWVAGYIDGDGWYLKRERYHQIEMHVGVVSSETIGLKLLQKAFGGVVKRDRGYYRWIKNLGPRDKQFALVFLKKMVNHTHLKKWKIEQLLSTYSQRLSVSTPTGEATV